MKISYEKPHIVIDGTECLVFIQPRTAAIRLPLNSEFNAKYCYTKVKIQYFHFICSDSMNRIKNCWVGLKYLWKFYKVK